jgi:hypothetical protein
MEVSVLNVMSAGSRLLVYLWLAGAANALAADPALSVSVDDQGGAISRADDVYGAVFNPFASVGIAVHQPAVEAPAQNGDWALPLVVALVGMVCIGVLVRKFLD